MHLRRFLASLALALLIVGAIVLLQHPDVAGDTILWRHVGNFAHVPLFGLVALTLLALLPHLLPRSLLHRGPLYGFALAGTVALAAASELMQLFTARDADVRDFVRDVIGATCFLGIFASFDRQLAGRALWRNAKLKHALRLGSVFLVLVTFSPVVMWAEAYRQRASNMPTLIGFSSSWELMFVEANDATLEVTLPPSGWTKPGGDLVGRLTFNTSRYPGLTIEEAYPDWHRFSFLTLSLFSELGDEVAVIIRIHDRHHDGRYGDRFNQKVPVQPGLNLVRIPLRNVQRAPDGREMDMQAIRAITLFAVEPAEPFTIYVDDLRLESG